MHTIQRPDYISECVNNFF